MGEERENEQDRCYYCSGRNKSDLSKVLPGQEVGLKGRMKKDNKDDAILDDDEEEENQFVTSHESCGSWTRLAATLSANAPLHHQFQQWQENEEYLQKLLTLANQPIRHPIPTNVRICSICINRYVPYIRTGDRTYRTS